MLTSAVHTAAAAAAAAAIASSGSAFGIEEDLAEDTKSGASWQRQQPLQLELAQLQRSNELQQLQLQRLKQQQGQIQGGVKIQVLQHVAVAPAAARLASVSPVPASGSSATSASASANAFVGANAVQVQVRSAAGQNLSLCMKSTSTIANLKQQLEDIWGAPVMCQRLLCGSEVLLDVQTLGQAVTGNSSSPPLQKPATTGAAAVAASLVESDAQAAEELQVMLVVSLDEARRRLSSPSTRMRLEALSAFSRAAPRGSRGAAAAVSSLLGDESPKVRTAALKTLTKVILPGQANEHTLELVLEGAADTQACVRVAALEVLPALAPASCVPTGLKVVNRLADSAPEVNSQALRTLAALFPQGDEKIADAVCKVLGHRRPEVQVNALKALAAITPRGYVGAQDMVGSMLDDREVIVRDQARSTFAQLVPLSERPVATALAKLLQGRGDARLAALRSLAREAPFGHDRTVQVLCFCIPKVKGLRVEALGVLCEIALRGDLRAVDAALACLGDARPEIRLAALRAVARLAPGRHPAALAAIKEIQLHDKQLGQEAQLVVWMLSQADDDQAPFDSKVLKVHTRSSSSSSCLALADAQAGDALAACHERSDADSAIPRGLGSRKTSRRRYSKSSSAQEQLQPLTYKLAGPVSSLGGREGHSTSAAKLPEGGLGQGCGGDGFGLLGASNTTLIGSRSQSALHNRGRSLLQGGGGSNPFLAAAGMLMVA